MGSWRSCESACCLSDVRGGCEGRRTLRGRGKGAGRNSLLPTLSPLVSLPGRPQTIMTDHLTHALSFSASLCWIGSYALAHGSSFRLRLPSPLPPTYPDFRCHPHCSAVYSLRLNSTPRPSPAPILFFWALAFQGHRDQDDVPEPFERRTHLQPDDPSPSSLGPSSPFFSLESRQACCITPFSLPEKFAPLER